MDFNQRVLNGYILIRGISNPIGEMQRIHMVQILELHPLEQILPVTGFPVIGKEIMAQ